ncbi:MAG: N-acetylglucosamine-6-phosphate deacetylase [Armatimonadaceae bacterium]
MSNVLAGISDARIVTGDGMVLETGTVSLRDGRVESVSAHSANSHGYLPAAGLTLLPGFLDVHIHGGGGADTMDATPEALRTLCRTHARFGTTGLLVTTMTQSGERIAAALENAGAAYREGLHFCPEGAQILGIHLEGPYINPKRPGAQPKEFVRKYDPEEFQSWLSLSRNALKLITLAPEMPGGSELIAACRAAGIVVSMGHTDASTEETKTALNHGVTHGTHLFNAMPSLHHRQPGPIAVLLIDDRARVEIIADGHHVAPEAIGLALRAKGADGVVLITDAMAGAGSGDGEYDLGGNPVTVAVGKATLADGTLAGSVLTMAQAAANMRRWFALDWNTLTKLTSGNAARQMGWTKKGRIAPGWDADFALVDDDLRVHATIVAGRVVYAA